MAIPPDQQGHAARIAQGHMAYLIQELNRPGGTGGLPTAQAIARRMMRSGLTFTGQNFQAFVGVAQRVLDSHQVAARMNSRPTQRASDATLPRDFALVHRTEQYRYVVRIQSPDTAGTRHGVNVELYLDHRATKSELEQLLRQHIDWNDYARPAEGRRVFNAMNPNTMTYTVVSAGRRP